MATQTFTWSPNIEPTGQTKFAVRKAQFGDGYSQEVADGINNQADSWPVAFTGDAAYVGPIRDFLDGLKGYQSFYWSPPLRAQGRFKANTYNLKAHGGEVYTLDVTFTEVFSA